MDLQAVNHVINKALVDIHEGEAERLRAELLDEGKGQTKIFAGPTKVHELATALEKVRPKKDVSRGTEHVYVRGIVGLVSDLKKAKAPAWVIKAVKEKAGSVGESDGLRANLEEGGVETYVPKGSPTFRARKVIHPKDQEEYGGGQKIRRIKMGNNSEFIARLRGHFGNYLGGVMFYATTAMPKTLADAGYDVWHVGRESGKDKWAAFRPKGIKIKEGARRASWSAYGEPAMLDAFKQKHGIE